MSSLTFSLLFLVYALKTNTFPPGNCVSCILFWDVLFPSLFSSRCSFNFCQDFSLISESLRNTFSFLQINWGFFSSILSVTGFLTWPHLLSKGCGLCHAVVWSLLNLFFGLVLWPALANVPLVLGKCLALLGTSWSTKWRHLAMWSDWLITFSPAYLYSGFLNFHFLKRFIETSQDGWICWLWLVMLPDIALCLRHCVRVDIFDIVILSLSYMKFIID